MESGYLFKSMGSVCGSYISARVVIFDCLSASQSEARSGGRRRKKSLIRIGSLAFLLEQGV
jgi:hypothetical protein